MQKKIQLFVVFILVLAIVVLANSNAVWAGFSQPRNESHYSADSYAPLKLAPAPSRTEITETGTYNIGSVCSFEVKYEPDAKLSGIVDVDVPTDFSSSIPFGYLGDLYRP